MAPCQTTAISLADMEVTESFTLLEITEELLRTAVQPKTLCISSGHDKPMMELLIMKEGLGKPKIEKKEVV